MNLVNSCNLEHFNLVLIPKLNFENSLNCRSVGCVIPVFARIDWAKIKCIILSAKKEEAGTGSREIYFGDVVGLCKWTGTQRKIGERKLHRKEEG